MDLQTLVHLMPALGEPHMAALTTDLIHLSRLIGDNGQAVTQFLTGRLSFEALCSRSKSAFAIADVIVTRKRFEALRYRVVPSRGAALGNSEFEALPLHVLLAVAEFLPTKEKVSLVRHTSMGLRAHFGKRVHIRLQRFDPVGSAVWAGILESFLVRGVANLSLETPPWFYEYIGNTLLTAEFPLVTAPAASLLCRSQGLRRLLVGNYGDNPIRLPSMPSLKRATVDGRGVHFDGAYPALKTLVVSGVTRETVYALACNAAGLTSLSIKNSDSSTILRALAERAENWVSLQHLKVVEPLGTTELLSEDAFEAIAKCGCLKRLTLRGGQIVDRALGQLKQSSIVHLKLAAVDVVRCSREGFAALARLTRLQSLDLSWTSVTRDELTAILCAAPHLVKLCVQGCTAITDEDTLPITGLIGESNRCLAECIFTTNYATHQMIEASASWTDQRTPVLQVFADDEILLVHAQWIGAQPPPQ